MPPTDHPTLPPETHIGHVHLTIADLKRSLEFYQQVLGFQVHEQKGGYARLGAGGPDLLLLTENPKAKPAPGHTGLYHFAVLMPSRVQLGHSLNRLIETQYPIQGAADHLVSEAIYLPDPDGNGIELYRDRPREDWPRLGDGSLQMANAPLDYRGIHESRLEIGETWDGLHPDTTIGHMHLHVADIPKAEAFYIGILGFERMVGWHNATFLSAGGYHHHLGANTWGTEGAPPPPPDSIGLREFAIQLPTSEAVNEIAERARSAGLTPNEQEAGLLIQDPSQNSILLTNKT
jgi:catechol 2,3-dioxygenase